MKTIDFNFDNVGGMSRLYLIGREDVGQVAWNHQRGIARISLRDRSAVYGIDTDNGDFSFSEKLTEDDAGPRYDVVLSGFIPRLDSVPDITVLERGEWLAVHVDGNGCILLSGTKEVPLGFHGEKTVSPRNGIAFELKGQEPSPSVPIDRRAFYI